MIKFPKLYEICSLRSFISNSLADVVTGSPTVFLFFDFVIKDEAHLHLHPLPDPASPQGYVKSFCNNSLLVST